MQKSKENLTIFIFNLIFLIGIIISDVFYIVYGALALKGFTSALFVALGLINLVYVRIKKTSKLKFAIWLFVGLFFAMLGDIVLNIHFISGAVLFAIGHILFVVAYSNLHKFTLKDLLFGACIFVPSILIITLVPIFNYGSVLMEIVCVVYALIISLMVGKAIGNFIKEKSILNLIVLIGSVLFFLSDFMLLFDVFSSVSAVFGILCLALYYPAEFLLAHSILHTMEKLNDKE